VAYELVLPVLGYRGASQQEMVFGSVGELPQLVEQHSNHAFEDL
jgi:hypothetical protein